MLKKGKIYLALLNQKRDKLQKKILEVDKQIKIILDIEI